MTICKRVSLVAFQCKPEQEIARRTEKAWRNYWAMKDPILTYYGAQTWSLIKVHTTSPNSGSANDQWSVAYIV